MPSPENICFVAENTLGKLSKWLRILGFDTIYEKRAAQPGIYEPHRIRLTRSQAVSRKRGDKYGEVTIFIASDHYQEQLKEIIETLNIKKGALSPFSRCIRCNAPIQLIDKESVLGKVPDYIFETHGSFWTCRQCRRIFWPGSHHSQTMDRIKRLFEG